MWLESSILTRSLLEDRCLLMVRLTMNWFIRFNKEFWGVSLRTKGFLWRDFRRLLPVMKVRIWMRRRLEFLLIPWYFRRRLRMYRGSFISNSIRVYLICQMRVSVSNVNFWIRFEFSSKMPNMSKLAKMNFY